MWGHDAKRSSFYHQGGVPARRYLPGDVNASETLDLSDLLLLMEHMFLSPVSTNCSASFDFNGSGEIDLADPISLVEYMFHGVAPADGIPTCQDFLPGDPLSCTRFDCP